MSDVEFDFDFSALVRGADIVASEMKQNVKKASAFLEGEAIKKAPIDQGQLRASMFHQVDDTGENIIGIVGNRAEHAPYVHNGTGIYAVEGNGRKKGWKVPPISTGKYKGDGWFTRGQKPQPFLEDAKQANKAQIEKLLGGG